MMLDVFKELNTKDWIRYKRSDGKNVDKITLSFGNVIQELMGWNYSDYLGVRTDGVNFEICKTIKGKGFKLGKCGNNGDTLAIHFKPPKKLIYKLTIGGQYITEYHVESEILKFKLETKEFIIPKEE